MFTAAAAAASADVRAKRNRFASHRSFSASELNGIKRRQQKVQTANALDILSTYLVVAEDGPGGNHNKLRSSSKTSIASSRESSRACSPVVEEQSGASLLPRHRPSAANTFFTNFFSSLPSEHHPSNSQHHKTSLSLPSPNGPLSHAHSSHSHSTSSIAELHCSTATTVQPPKPPAVEVVAMLRDPAWSEIARLSHSDDMEDVDGHGHRCGHRRRYDRQSSPFDAYVARKRFISAINRIRMESMVCSALNQNGSPTGTTTTKSVQKMSTLTEHSEQQQQQPPTKPSRKDSSPLPPQVLVINDDDEDDDNEGDHHSSTTTISMAELRQELDQTTLGNSSQCKLWHRNSGTTSTPARASSSPQIAQQESSPEEEFDDGLNWAPLMQGRAIERSTSSATHRPPTNFAIQIESSSDHHPQQKDSSRQRSSSATSMTMFLEQEAAAAATAANNRSKSPNRSPEKKLHHSKHSFMALIRIKMFSVKRQRRPLKEKEENEKEEKVKLEKPKG